MSKLRIVVTGGRDFADGTLVHAALTKLHQEYGILELAEGGARGADRLARIWCWENSVVCRCWPADWSRGKRAGPERNRQMLDNFRPDMLVAFSGGRGTADCMMAARERGVPVWEPRWQTPEH